MENSSVILYMATRDPLLLTWYSMMTSSNGNNFRVTGPLRGEFTGHRWIPFTKASDTEVWCFFICTWTNGWLNNRDAGDLRRHPAHYDVIVMALGKWSHLYKLWDELTYLFPNFNGAAVEVWEWISNFIPHFSVYVIVFTLWARWESTELEFGCNKTEVSFELELRRKKSLVHFVKGFGSHINS